MSGINSVRSPGASRPSNRPGSSKANADTDNRRPLLATVDAVGGGSLLRGVPTTDPQTWSADEVQAFFQHAEGGKLRPFASRFALVDGALLCSLTDENLAEILPGAQGLVVSSALRVLNTAFRRRRDSASGAALRVDVAGNDDSEFSEATSFPPICIMPSRAAWCVAFLFLGTAALLATVFNADMAELLQCVPNSNDGANSDTLLMLQEPQEHQDTCSNRVLTYASIVVISTVFTYGHIWMALWMTFYPVYYVGCCQLPHGDDNTSWLATTFGNMGLGWQGIIPFKATKMARTAVRLMTSKLLDIRQVFSRIDPARVAEEIEPALHNLLGPIVDAVGRERAPTAWEMTPFVVKQEIIARAERDTPQVIANMMHDLKENIEECFDLEEMVVDTFVKDKNLLIEMFIKCGRAELSVIRNFGGWMGFAFGVLQMILFHYMPNAPWMLPVFGGVVGAATNWVALLMIFKPTWPVNLCGCYTLQGLFLKRQSEVAAGYAHMTTTKVISTPKMLRELVRGRSSDKLLAIVHRHVMACVDEQAGHVRPLAELVIGSEEYERIKRAIGNRVVESIEEMMGHAEGYFDEALDLERTLHVKMSALPPDEFESILRPVFSEDEWKLIALGGILGVFIGFFQMYVLGS